MKWLLAIYCIVLSASVQAQTLKGKLFGQDGSTKGMLPGGTISWLGTARGTTPNENGVFELSTDGIVDFRLVATHPGYVTDTINVAGKTYVSIVLRKDVTTLAGVTITDRKGAYVSSLSVNQVEVINQHELSKAACCDLAGCFGTQASVQPQTTNVVTNAQELRILGLSGVYNQLLVDGFPMLQGLSYTYGVSTFPGTIVDNIYVSKGTTSVLQGYESISGQINLVTRQPNNTDRLLLNAYMNNFGELHLNTNVAGAIGKQKKWHGLLALHTVQPARKIDGNEDGFLDLPQLTRYMVYSKLMYGNEKKEGFSTQLGLRLTSEQRIGGQMAYNASMHEGSNLIYGQSVQYLQPEATIKSTYRFSATQAVVLSASAYGHQQDSWFGTTHYVANQQSGYANLQHEWLWREKHQLKYGISYRYQHLREQISFADTALGRSYAGNYLTNLSVPGFFAENTFRWWGEKITLITGARADRHQLWGWRLTPRTMVKYVVNSSHTFRASVGSGWRQVNLFSEQTNLLVSSRDIVFSEVLRPEAAVNAGVSHTYRFTAGSVAGTITGDFYTTQFTNQFFPEYNVAPTKVYIRNFQGTSRSNGVQLDASLRFFQRLELRMAYNYLDVYRIENNQRVLLPFNPRNRTMAALSYRTKSNNWQADVNTHWFDKMTLPNTQGNPVPYQRSSQSNAYVTLNAQLTYRWKKLEVYGGCENIANYRQPNPIISADNPFGKYFDLSSVWGPTRGREVYLGARFGIK